LLSILNETIVTPPTLNVRQTTNENPEILGKVYQGDTIFPTRDYFYWMEFDYNGGKEYVNVKF